MHWQHDGHTEDASWQCCKQFDRGTAACVAQVSNAAHDADRDTWLILNCRRPCYRRRRPRCSWHLSCGGGVLSQSSLHVPLLAAGQRTKRVIWAWWGLLDLQALIASRVCRGARGRWFTLKVTKFHDYTHWALKDYTEIEETVRNRLCSCSPLHSLGWVYAAAAEIWTAT